MKFDTRWYGIYSWDCVLQPLTTSMSDSESDDDDLFADFEALDDVDDNINVSANLIGGNGVAEEKVAAKTEVDDGKRIEWVAPSVSGLKNSNTVNSTEKHWYKDEVFKNKPDSNKRKPASMFGATTPNNSGRMAPAMAKGPNGVSFW